MSQSLADKLSALPDFAGLDGDTRQRIADLGVLVKTRPSEIVCEQGDVPEGLYLVRAGTATLVHDPEAETPVVVDTLHEGAFFGTDSLFEETPAARRVQMGDDEGILQHVSRGALAEFLAADSAVAEQLKESHRLNAIINFLSSAHSLETVPAEGIIALAKVAQLKEVKAGYTVIHQGEAEDHLFIVKSGSFVVTRNEAPNNRIAALGEGALIGEMAVLSGEPRAANVAAETDSELYEISGEAFRALVAAHEELSANLDQLMRVRTEEISEKEERRKKRAAEIERKEAERKERIERSEAEAAEKTKKVEVEKGFWQRFSKPPAIRQHSEMDCSAACLCTVIKTYGKTISINIAREVARVKQDGASMANVIRAAKEFGFHAEAYVSTVEQLRERTLPAIVNWKGYHWIVVHEMKENSVVAADPAQGLITITLEEFEANWSRYTIFLEPTASFEELEESKPSFQAFYRFFAPHKRTISEVFAAAVFLQVIGVMTPLFTKFVVDDVILKGDRQWLMIALFVMGGAGIINMLLTYVRDNMVLRLSMRCNLDLIGHVYDRMLRLPMTFFENRRTGDITSRLEQHEEITQFLTEDGLETFLALMTGIVYFFFMIYFNAWLTFAALSFLVFDLFIIRYISPRIRQINRETFVKQAEAESHLIESLRGAETLKTIGADFMARWKYENHFAAVANMEFKEAKLGQIAGLFSGTLDSLGDIAVLFLGGTFVIQGKMTIGELMAFTVFANGVQGPVNAIIGKWDELQEVFVAIERLNDVLEKEPEFGEGIVTEKELIELPMLRGDVEFRNVGFRYEPDDPSNVVQNVSLKIPAGQKVAFVGASGCGKSTLIKLMYAFYPPSEGQILVDGFSITDVSIPSLRRQIAMVPQDNLIFKGTIRDNIALANEQATLEEIREAAELAGADEFINKMAGGFESMIEEQGSNLSGGQRQRLVLARAFLQQSSILVLDEATSALDNESERLVMENVMTHFRDRTVFIIAHRLSTVRTADLIIVLNNGLVAETGSHQELIDQKGLYYHLSARQLSVE